MRHPDQQAMIDRFPVAYALGQGMGEMKGHDPVGLQRRHDRVSRLLFEATLDNNAHDIALRWGQLDALDDALGRERTSAT